MVTLLDSLLGSQQAAMIGGGRLRLPSLRSLTLKRSAMRKTGQAYILACETLSATLSTTEAPSWLPPLLNRPSPVALLAGDADFSGAAVNISMPVSVTRRVSSNCALRFPSLVTAVH